MLQLVLHHLQYFWHNDELHSNFAITQLIRVAPGFVDKEKKFRLGKCKQTLLVGLFHAVFPPPVLLLCPLPPLLYKCSHTTCFESFHFTSILLVRSFTSDPFHVMTSSWRLEKPQYHAFPNLSMDFSFCICLQLSTSSSSSVPEMTPFASSTMVVLVSGQPLFPR